MAFDLKAAEQAGWTITPESPTRMVARKAGREIVAVSDDPQAALIANLAEAEGQPVAVGYGLPDPNPPAQEKTIEERLDELEAKVAAVEIAVDVGVVRR